MPRPAAFRVVFRRPLALRVREGAAISAFVLLGVGSVAGLVLAIAAGGELAVGVVAACMGALVTSVVILGMLWIANRIELSEGKVDLLVAEPGDPPRCLAWVEGERWTMPFPTHALREEERIQVRYRVVGPRGEIEIVEVRVAAEG